MPEYLDHRQDDDDDQTRKQEASKKGKALAGNQRVKGQGKENRRGHQETVGHHGLPAGKANGLGQHWPERGPHQGGEKEHHQKIHHGNPLHGHQEKKGSEHGHGKKDRVSDEQGQSRPHSPDSRHRRNGKSDGQETIHLHHILSHKRLAGKTLNDISPEGVFISCISKHGSLLLG